MSADERLCSSTFFDLREAGFEILGTADCVIEGPKGNLEAFVHARRTP